jgi:hypothetical protein
MQRGRRIAQSDPAGQALLGLASRLREATWIMPIDLRQAACRLPEAGRRHSGSPPGSRTTWPPPPRSPKAFAALREEGPTLGRR